MKERKANVNLKKKNISFFLPADWGTVSLGELGTFSKGKGILKEQISEIGFPCVRYGDIYTMHDFIIKEFKSFVSEEVAQQSKPIRKGDMLFAGSGETIDEIGKAVAYVSNEDAFAGGDVIILSTNKKVNVEWLAYALETDLARKQKRVLGQGNSIVHIYPRDLAKLRIAFPPDQEQRKIANILSLMDTIINKSTVLVRNKELKRKWLMRQLLSGRCRVRAFSKSNVRHKTSLGELPVDWKLTSLNNILTPVKKRFTPERDKLYKQIGIRSHTKGIFIKEEVTGAVLGNKNVFWIEPNCFIVNIVFAWEHAIAKTTENEVGLIASHRFPMFKPKTGVLDLDFLLYYFKSSRGKYLLELASPGGAGRNKTLGQSEFRKCQIPLPSFAEQSAIAKTLQAVDCEIQLLKDKTEKLIEKKKGFMQVLLTGRKRLKIK